MHETILILPVVASDIRHQIVSYQDKNFLLGVF